MTSEHIEHPEGDFRTAHLSGPIPHLMCEEHARNYLELRFPEGWAEHGAETYARYCEEAASFLHR